MLLQLALNSANEIVGIYDVPTGKKCNCFCPECGEPLEAKNRGKSADAFLLPNQKIAHFSHHDGSLCAAALETAIHLLAKQVLKEVKRLLIPPISYKGKLLVNKQLIKFNDVEVEKTICENGITIKPDAILIKQGRELFIEFYKTHCVDETKESKIKLLGKSCLEININGIPPLKNGKPNKEDILVLLEQSAESKEWIFNAHEENLKSKFEEALKAADNNKINDHIQTFNSASSRGDASNHNEKTERFKRRLLNQGYQLLKVYEYKEYDSYYNEHNGRGKTFKTVIGKEENVYCPELKSEEKNNRIELLECEFCHFHKTIVYEVGYQKLVACGYKNNLSQGE